MADKYTVKKDLMSALKRAKEKGDLTKKFNSKKGRVRNISMPVKAVEGVVSGKNFTQEEVREMNKTELDSKRETTDELAKEFANKITQEQMEEMIKRKKRNQVDSGEEIY
jgi:hypothetical protein